MGFCNRIKLSYYCLKLHLEPSYKHVDQRMFNRISYRSLGDCALLTVGVVSPLPLSCHSPDRHTPYAHFLQMVTADKDSGCLSSALCSSPWLSCKLFHPADVLWRRCSACWLRKWLLSPLPGAVEVSEEAAGVWVLCNFSSLTLKRVLCC